MGFFQLPFSQRSFGSGSLSCCLGVYDFAASVDKPVQENLIKPQMWLVSSTSEGETRAKLVPLIGEIHAWAFNAVGLCPAGQRRTGQPSVRLPSHQ